MLAPLRFWIVLALVPLGCSTEAPQPVACRTASPLAAAPGLSLRTQAIGASASCTDPVACTASCEARAAELRKGRPGPRTLRFDGAECVMLGMGGTAAMPPGASAPACDCKIGSGSLFLARHFPGCARHGRTFQCLYLQEEAPVCKIGGPPGVCQQACQDLEDRIAADDARDYEVKVHGALCTERGCDCVMEMAGACYSWLPFPYPCSVSAQEIVAREAERLVPQSPATPASHGGADASAAASMEICNRPAP